MMYFLVIVACLNGNCADYTVAEGLTFTACMSASQIEAARWAGNHPDHKIKSIRCEFGKET
jgi:hypothetical protein